MVAAPRTLTHTYILHGCGGLTTVQTRLAGYGICYANYWEPGPPDWRFHYLTYLQLEELVQLLNDVKDHFIIRFYLDESVHGSEFQVWSGSG